MPNLAKEFSLMDAPYRPIDEDAVKNLIRVVKKYVEDETEQDLVLEALGVPDDLRRLSE